MSKVYIYYPDENATLTEARINRITVKNGLEKKYVNIVTFVCTFQNFHIGKSLPSFPKLSNRTDVCCYLFFVTFASVPMY